VKVPGALPAGGTRWKAFAVFFLILLITVLHYTIDPNAGAVHDVLLRAYYLPIVLAGLSFGLGGGLLAAFVVSIVFLPHALHGWDAPYTAVFRLIEIGMYYVIGGLTGFMSSRTRNALEAERQARREREGALGDLREKTLELFRIEEELRRKDRLAALGRMSAGLAHEIRNPLSSIRTASEILLERILRNETKDEAGKSTQLLEIIGEESSRLDRTLSEFLRFARIDDTPGEELPRECILSDAVAGVLDMLGPEFENRNIRTECSTEDMEVIVSVREDHLRQILMNVLLNAAQAMPEGGRLEIRLGSSEAPDLELMISDSGPGIPPASASKIFDPFFSTREGGTGLGLSIVARMLEASGGGIRLDQTYSDGARFCLTLPRQAERCRL